MDSLARDSWRRDASLSAPPRVITAATRTGPLFDLREEAGGLHGAGWTFLAVPINSEPYRIQLHWDMADMPAGSRGIWSFGEGDVTKVAPAEQLASSFYFAGPVKSYPAQPTGRFAMYWLSEPPFDVAAAAGMIQKLFDYMSGFFHDDGGSYRVFMRKTPSNGGGTALTRSFMFGYSRVQASDRGESRGLIAHEMVHNWPTLGGRSCRHVVVHGGFGRVLFRRPVLPGGAQYAGRIPQARERARLRLLLESFAEPHESRGRYDLLEGFACGTRALRPRVHVPRRVDAEIRAAHT